MDYNLAQKDYPTLMCTTFGFKGLLMCMYYLIIVMLETVKREFIVCLYMLNKYIYIN